MCTNEILSLDLGTMFVETTAIFFVFNLLVLPHLRQLHMHTLVRLPCLRAEDTFVPGVGSVISLSVVKTVIADPSHG